MSMATNLRRCHRRRRPAADPIVCHRRRRPAAPGRTDPPHHRFLCPAMPVLNANWVWDSSKTSVRLQSMTAAGIAAGQVRQPSFRHKHCHWERAYVISSFATAHLVLLGAPHHLTTAHTCTPDAQCSAVSSKWQQERATRPMASVHVQWMPSRGHLLAPPVNNSLPWSPLLSLSPSSSCRSPRERTPPCSMVSRVSV